MVHMTDTKHILLCLSWSVISILLLLQKSELPIYSELWTPHCTYVPNVLSRIDCIFLRMAHVQQAFFPQLPPYDDGVPARLFVWAHRL